MPTRRQTTRSVNRSAPPKPSPPQGAPTSPNIDRQEMGRRLRAIRKHQGLTLKQVSERSAVTLPTLSKMELGQVSISYDKFAAVAKALGIEIGRLFDARGASAPPQRRPTFSRITPRNTPQYASDHYEHHILAADYPAKAMTPAYATIRARDLSEFTGYNRHPGEEFLYVVSGRVRVCFETGETLLLGTHEGTYFDSGVGHVYLSVGRKNAEVVMVMTP